MKEVWFKKYGWIYLPIHSAGYIITVLAILFLLPVCIAVIRNGHSVTDDLYTIFVFASCTCFWWKWIAEKTCKQE